MLRHQLDQTEEEYERVVQAAFQISMQTGEKVEDVVHFRRRFTPWAYMSWAACSFANVALVRGFNLTGWRMVLVSLLTPLIITFAVGRVLPVSRYRIELR